MNAMSTQTFSTKSDSNVAAFVVAFVLTVVFATLSPGWVIAQTDSNIASPPILHGAGADSSAAPRTRKKKLKFRKHGGIVYESGQTHDVDYELKCDVYVPNGEGPFPAVLAVHGGAWTSGSKLHLIRHAWRLAASGYVVVAINYRHAPQFKFPAQIHDCKQAVRWMRKNSESYKIAPNRIGGYGYSAGGHLVSLLGTTDIKDGLEGQIDPGFQEFDTRLQAVAAGGAPCEFSWVGTNSLAYWIGATTYRRPALYVRAAPTTYVDSGDPPFYLYHGENDAVVPLSSTLALRKKLEHVGIVCTHEMVKGKGHLATFSDFEAFDHVIEFFDRTLKPHKPGH